MIASLVYSVWGCSTRIAGSRIRSALKAVFRFPGVPQWWTTADFTLTSPEFIALVEKILVEVSERGE